MDYDNLILQIVNFKNKLESADVGLMNYFAKAQTKATLRGKKLHTNFIEKLYYKRHIKIDSQIVGMSKHLSISEDEFRNILFGTLGYRKLRQKN